MKSSLLRASGHQIDNNVLKGKILPYRDEYEHVSAGKVFFDNFSKDPDFVAQVHTAFEREVTYREMKDRSVRCALWLKKQRISQDDVITIMSEINMDCFIPFLAAAYIGVPVHPLLPFEKKEKMFQHIMSITRPKIAFVSEKFIKLMIDIVKQENLDVKIVVFGDVPGFESFSTILEQQDKMEIDRFQCTEITDPRHTLIIIFTSGTTGQPKGVMISHRNILREVQCHGYLHFNNKVSITFSVLSWITGLQIYTYAFTGNVKMIMCPCFEEELFCKLVQKYKIESASLTIQCIIRLLNYSDLAKYDFSSLNFLSNGGSYLRPEIVEACKRRLPNTRIIHLYGMTEVGLITELIDEDQKGGSCGKVSRSVELKVVDTTTGKLLGPNEKGEICIKNDKMMLGYYKNAEATREFIDDDGWAHTGDIGYYDEDGYVFHFDRIKQLIRYRDYQVSPIEIENVLTSCPGVKNAVVVPVSHSVDGEHPMAFVEKVPGAKVTEQELMDLVASKLEDYKQIRGGITFLDEIPQGPFDKVFRGDLKDMAQKLRDDKSL